MPALSIRPGKIGDLIVMKPLLGQRLAGLFIHLELNLLFGERDQARYDGLLKGGVLLHREGIEGKVVRLKFKYYLKFPPPRLGGLIGEAKDKIAIDILKTDLPCLSKELTCPICRMMPFQGVELFVGEGLKPQAKAIDSRI
jgi:hypothetical protein